MKALGYRGPGVTACGHVPKPSLIADTDVIVRTDAATVGDTECRISNTEPLNVFLGRQQAQ